MEPHIFKGTTHFLREPHVLPHYLCGSDIIVCCNWILLSYTLLFTANRHTKYLMCFMYAFLMSNETVLSVERFCTCLTFISHSIMDTSHMPLKCCCFFLPIENIAYTVCTVAWFSLHWLLMHDLLNHISDLVPYIVSTISLETDDLSTSCWNLPYHSFPGAADVLSVALSTVEWDRPSGPSNI